MRWHTKPIMQLVVMFVVMVAIVGVQQTAASYLSSNRSNVSTPSLSVKEGGRVDVQAGLPDPTCPNDAPVQFALTENRTNMAPPRRMRYSDAPWEYDSLSALYFTRHDSETDFQQTDIGLKSENLLLRQNDPLDDTQNISNLMSSMFQYKLTRFKNAYVLKYTSAVIRDDPSPHKGNAPAIEVPSKPGWPVCMPTTGYDVGGGYDAMVVSVEGDRITLHIGIHEYMDGNDTSLGGCPLGNNNCKGGYWIYISGITVSPDIAGAYATKGGLQRASDLQREITHRLELPIVAPGKKLGTSNGDSVIVAVRDSGPLIYANKVFMWGGSYPVRDDLLPADATPTVRPTAPPPTSPPNNTPGPTNPTSPPSTPRPTSPTTPQPTNPPNTTVSPRPTDPPGQPNCTYSQDNCNWECMSGTSCTTNCRRNLRKTHYCEPLPTVTVDETFISVTFATCNSTICMRLSEVSNDTFNNQQGALYWDSATDPRLFRLGNQIEVTSSGSRKSFKLTMLRRLTNTSPTFAYLNLPHTDTATRYYIVGRP